MCNASETMLEQSDYARWLEALDWMEVATNDLFWTPLNQLIKKYETYTEIMQLKTPKDVELFFEIYDDMYSLIDFTNDEYSSDKMAPLSISFTDLVKLYESDALTDLDTGLSLEDQCQLGNNAFMLFSVIAMIYDFGTFTDESDKLTDAKDIKIFNDCRELRYASSLDNAYEHCISDFCDGATYSFMSNDIDGDFVQELFDDSVADDLLEFKDMCESDDVIMSLDVRGIPHLFFETIREQIDELIEEEEED